MKNILALAALLVAFSLPAQYRMMIMNGDTIYVEIPTKGDELMEKEDYEGAIKAYRKDFKEQPERVAYNYSCALALTGQTDSAFKYLLYDLYRDSAFGYKCLTDPDLITLHRDARWAMVKDTAIALHKISSPGKIKNYTLAALLWDMSAWDQAYYRDLAVEEKKNGRDSRMSMALWELKERINRENVRTLDSIVLSSGWPKISEVGSMAANAAFLVVQHSNLALQEKYLPTIKALCGQQEASWQSYALMYDRVQMGNNRPQLYGSQAWLNPETQQMEMYPIEDEANVNQRRAAMGMGPIEQYAAMLGVKYTPKK